MSDLPAGWRRLSLAEVGEGGLFVDGDWVESKDQDPAGTVRLTQLADVGEACFRNRSDRWMREEQAERLRCTRLQPGDLLIARMPEPLARCAEVPAGIGAAVTAVDVAVLRVARADIFSRYIMWAINSPDFRRAAERLQSGTTRKRISRKRLGTLAVPVPPLDEQHRIVAVVEDHLSRLDAASAGLDQDARLAALRRSALRQGLEPLYAAAPAVALSNVAATALGKMLDAARTAGDATPYLRNVNVRWGRVDLSDVAEVPLTAAERARFSLRAGDLLVCEGGEPGRCAVWDGRLDGMAYQKALHRIRPTADIEADFLALVIEAFATSPLGARQFTGTTIKHLPQERLRRIPVPQADKAQQQRLSIGLAELREESERLRTAALALGRKADVTRRALLTSAFSASL